MEDYPLTLYPIGFLLMLSSQITLAINICNTKLTQGD